MEMLPREVVMEATGPILAEAMAPELRGAFKLQAETAGAHG